MHDVKIYEVRPIWVARIGQDSVRAVQSRSQRLTSPGSAELEKAYREHVEQLMKGISGSDFTVS